MNMKTHTLHGWIILLSVGCLVAGLALVPAGASAATAPINGSTLAVTDTTVERNAKARVRVSLDRVPAGLAGYELTLRLRSESVANVTGASYPDDFRPTTDPQIGASGQTVTLEAADLSSQIEPGETNVTLATVNVSGVKSGTARVVVTDFQVDADNGSRVNPTLDAGKITVSQNGALQGTSSVRGSERGASQNAAQAGSTTTRTDADSSTPAGTTTGTGPGLGIIASISALMALALLSRRA